jgi:hypothetical protein
MLAAVASGIDVDQIAQDTQSWEAWGQQAGAVPSQAAQDAQSWASWGQQHASSTPPQTVQDAQSWEAFAVAAQAPQTAVQSAQPLQDGSAEQAARDAQSWEAWGQQTGADVGRAAQDVKAWEAWGQQALGHQSWSSDAQGLEAQGQEAQARDVQAQEVRVRENVPAPPSEPPDIPPMPDISWMQQQGPASWTSAIFDQTARELWQRLQEEGHAPEEIAEQFQNHMVAVYTQMQTQQAYEQIADSNAEVTAALESFQPKDPMEKLQPLFKGDKNEPHRTAMGVDPLMKYYERSKNAPFGIFVGGLRTVSNEDVLVKYFAQFGEITFVEVKRLPDRTSRGFGFLHYVNDEGVQKVLAHKDQHMIDGKLVDCKRMEPMETTKMSQKKRAREQAQQPSSSGWNGDSSFSAFQGAMQWSQPY